MKNYDYYKNKLKTTCSSFVERELITDYQTELAGCAYTDKFKGTGRCIVNKNPNLLSFTKGVASLPIKVLFEDGSIRDLNYPYSFQFVKEYDYDPRITSISNRYIDLANKLYADLSASKKAAEQASVRAAEEMARKRRAQANEERAIKKLRTMKAELEDANDMSTVVGWLAKHVQVMKAEVPASKEKRFVEVFGSQALRKVVDDSRRTSGGYKMKLDWSVDIPLVGDLTNRPACLDSVLSPDKTHITSLKFAIGLVNDYGFMFAEQQDLDAIKSYIPTKDMKKFNEGFAA